MSDMQTTTPRRIALLPVEARTGQDRPAIRRYRLARVLDASIAAHAGAAQAPATGVRSP
jgi:hypothetical protein